MTAVEASSDDALLERVLVRGVRGHVACARGPHKDVDSVAIWHVSAEGTPCGAWVWRWPATVEDARRAVSLIDGRLLVDVDSDAAVAVLAELAGIAEITDLATKRAQVQVVTPSWLLGEVAAFHAELQKAFDEAATARATARGSKLVPLDLPPLPDQLTGALTAQLAALGLQVPPAVSPVIAQTSGTANLISWLIRLWQDAEGQRMRRSYLRIGAEAQPLSTAWLNTLRQANTQLLIQA